MTHKLEFSKAYDLLHGEGGELGDLVDYVNENFVSMERIIKLADELTSNRNNLSRCHGVLDLVEAIKGESNEQNSK